MAKIIIPAKIEELKNGMDFIKETLEKRHVRKKTLYKALLISEEVMVKLMENANDTSTVRISIKVRYGMPKIAMSCGGEAFDKADFSVDIPMDELETDDEATIRSVLLDAFSKNISYTRKGKYNYVYIHSGETQKVFVIRSAIAIFLGYLITAILQMILTPDILTSFATDVLLPIQTLYLNALSLITAPAIFLSIVMAVVRYRAFADPGRVSIKVMLGYLFTTVVAVLVGIQSFYIYDTSNFNKVIFTMPGVGEGTGVISVLDIFTNIIPTNIITPFENTDALQLLFIALIFGFGVSGVGDTTPFIKEMFEGLDKLLKKIVEVVTEMIPSQAFFSVMLALIYFGNGSLIASSRLFLITMGGFIVMLLMYIIIIPVLGRINPLPFFKKYITFVVRNFLKARSVEVIADSIIFCKDKLGISNKVSSFSIPFGAIANLDGNCIYLTIATLFLAKMNNIEIFESNLIYLILIIIILSIGSPITPGSAMIALTLLMNQIGLPMELLSIVVVINAFVEMIMDEINSTGDFAITLVIAKSENKFNKEVYKS